MPTDAPAATADQGTSRGKKGQRSRARLLAAAAVEFAESGYHDTKVSAIVARAGLTQAAFYRYFPSKEAIFAELIAELRHRLRLLADAARLRPGLSMHDLPGRIQATMEMGFRFLQENVALASIGFFLAPEAQEIKAEVVALIAENLRAEREASYIRPQVAIELAAESVVAIMLRLAQTHLFPGKRSPTSLGAQTADLILHGLFNVVGSAATERSDETGDTARDETKEGE
jgi:AcrR family transcriptional regulator